MEEGENHTEIKNESLQATEESVPVEESVPDTSVNDETAKKLQEAEEKIAKLEENLNSKTDFIKSLEQQKVSIEKELLQVVN